MYYHIVIKPKSDRFYGEYKCDLTEEQLLSRYINPYAEGRPIVINGKTIKPDDLERIRITTTPAPAQTYVPALEAEDRNSSVVVLGGPSYLQQAIASGSDVTDDYIKGPPGFSQERMPSMVETHPGNSSDRSILEQIRRIEARVSKRCADGSLTVGALRIDAAEFCGQLKKILGPDHSDLDEFYAIRDKKISSSELVNVAQGFVDRLRVTISKLENGLTSLAAGRSVFFGHGQSAVWRELKDFVQDRLGLPWDEFNRDSVAGLATTERLTAMLESAGFAFLILTAEDELADGKTQARPNVIHEVGLFQGKLGFRKAIILLEEGCSEFSNIVGLSQIRFPKGRISACFEDVRQVLTREGLIRT